MHEAERNLLVEFLRNIFNCTPKERASVDKVLAHDWFEL